MRVVLGEDLPLLRDGLIRLLEANGFLVVETADNAPALQRAIIGNRPDVTVADVRLAPGYAEDGLRAVLQARREQPGAPVIMVAQHVEQSHARDLLADRARGFGYLLKDRLFDVEWFLQAMRQVGAGGVVMDTEIVAQLLSLRSALDDPLSLLSPREREVLTLVAEGRTTAAIATELFVSEKTIGGLVDAIFEKLALPQPDDDGKRTLAVLTYLSD